MSAVENNYENHCYNPIEDVGELDFGNEKTYRYARSTLFSLRNCKNSIEKPECFFRADLQELGFWRTSTSKLEKVRSHPKLSTPRNGKAPIDPRSISSSHLLPAFAKRRLVSSDINEGSDSSDSTKKGDSEVYSKYERNRNDLDIGFLQENGKALHENGNVSPTYTIPPPYKMANYFNDKRIGSGRFLPRDCNWEQNSVISESSTNNLSKDIICSSKSQISKAAPDLKTVAKKSEIKEKKLFDKRNLSNSYSEENMQNCRQDNGINRRFSSKAKSNIHTDGGIHQKVTFDRSKRYQNHNDSKEEPEWFSEGPTSKLDTIELRGFDEYDDNNSSIDTTKSIPGLKECSVVCGSSNWSGNIFETKNNEFINNSSRNQTPIPINTETDSKHDSNINQTYDEIQNKQPAKEEITSFNLENFLSMDHLENSIIHVTSQFNPENSSKFSQWFNNSSSTIETVTKNSPSPTNGLNPLDNEDDSKNENKTLIEFLKAGNINHTMWNNKPIHVHSIPSVKDLEAQMQKINTRLDNQKEINEHSNASKMSGTESKNCQNMEVFNNFLSKFNESAVKQTSRFPIKSVDNIKTYEMKEQFEKKLEKNDLLSPDAVTHRLNRTSFNDRNMEASRIDIVNNIPKSCFENDSNLPHYPPNQQMPVSANRRNHGQGVVQAPSPLSFTPTSVLRKMTAERETHQNGTPSDQIPYKINCHDNLNVSDMGTNFTDRYPPPSNGFMPRMILGGQQNNIVPARPEVFANGMNRYTSAPPTFSQDQKLDNLIIQQNKWPFVNANHINYMTKPQGRPILKGNMQTIPYPTYSPHIQHGHAGKIEYSPAYQNDFMGKNQMNSPIYMQQPGQLQAIRIFENNQHLNNAPLLNISAQQSFHQSEPEHNMGNVFREGNFNKSLEINTFQREKECLSPTSNQLTQWFSPQETTPTKMCRAPFEYNQKSLTLEEFEKQIRQNHPSTVVNN